MTPEEEAAGLLAFTNWAATEIANASWIQRGAIQQYVETHKKLIVDVIGPAILAAHEAAKETQ